MTTEQLTSRYEDLRTRFKGGFIRYGWNALHLDAGIRGRAAIRMTMPHDDISPHRDHGSFIFAGYLFDWFIYDCLGELTLTLEADEDMLKEKLCPKK